MINFNRVLWFIAESPESFIFTLGHHRRRRVLLWVLVSDLQSVPNDVTTLTLLGFQLSAWNLAGWYTVPWSRPLFKMAMLAHFLHVLRNFKIFHGRLGPGIWPILEMQGNHIMAWNLVAWCSVPWSRLLFETATLIQCSHFLVVADRGCCHAPNVLLFNATSVIATFWKYCLVSMIHQSLFAWPIRSVLRY